MKKTLLYVGVLLMASGIMAQEKKLLKKEQKTFNTLIEQSRQANPNDVVRCASVEAVVAKFGQRKVDQMNQAFEEWLAPKIELEKQKKTNNKSAATTVITIPVVFHVITSGSGNTNVDASYVQAQIDQLNIDYRNLAGSPFSAAADAYIEFCLAAVDPDGNVLDEPGIDRVTDYGASSLTKSYIDGTVKPNTIWDPYSYFNVWSANISNGLLGWATFPTSSGLGGLTDYFGTDTTDGVVVAYYSIGSIATPNPNGGIYGMGRTLTHEAGHWLGLRHIWGDNTSCSVNTTDSNQDYCPDTPAASDAHYDCVTIDSCPDDTGNDMIEDYTNDACMNTFTADQVARMTAVMANSPRRVTLASSTVCNATVYGFDGKLSITTLDLVDCATSTAPVVTLKNAGDTTVLTSATIAYALNGTTLGTYNWSGSLATGSSVDITLPTVSFASGSNTFTVSLTSVNGVTDNDTSNDSDSETVTVNSYLDTDSITIAVQPDVWGDEITWELINSLGTVVASGGPYSLGTMNNVTGVCTTDGLDQQTVTLAAECYTFTIHDSYGDGIVCQSELDDYGYTGGGGYFSLSVNGTPFVAQTCEEYDEWSISFGIESAMNASSFDTNDFVLYPNPNNGSFNLQLTAISNKVAVNVYDMRGRLILNKQVQANGLVNEAIELTNAQAGIYLVTIEDGARKVTKKIVVE
jgi:hypothetical protein